MHVCLYCICVCLCMYMYECTFVICMYVCMSTYLLLVSLFYYNVQHLNSFSMKWCYTIVF